MIKFSDDQNCPTQNTASEMPVILLIGVGDDGDTLIVREQR